jgi:ribosomal protein S18 acetylase RimI-like enzyme
MIRKATHDDVPAMAALQAAGWADAFGGLVPPERTPSAEELTQRLYRRFPTGTRLVAESEGRMRGFCAFGASRDDDAGPGIGEIYVLFVAPSDWRRGIGGALAERALEQLDEFEQVTLWSAAENARANRFYERLGFVPDGAEQVREEFGNVREIRYRRTLRPRP